MKEIPGQSLHYNGCFVKKVNQVITLSNTSNQKRLLQVSSFIHLITWSEFNANTDLLSLEVFNKLSYLRHSFFTPTQISKLVIICILYLIVYIFQSCLDHFLRLSKISYAK